MSGVSLKAVLFDGVDQSAIGADLNDKEDDFAFSISCRFKTNDTDGWLLVKVDNSLVRGYGMYVNSTGQVEILLGQRGVRSVEVGTSASFNDGNYHHIIATHSGSGTAAGWTFYEAGSSVAKAAPVRDDLAGGFVTNNGDQIIGGRVSTEFLAATIDDTAIYGIELSAGQVTTVHGVGGDPVDLTSVGPFADLENYWVMGDTPDAFPTLFDKGSIGNDLAMTNMASGDIVNDPAQLLLLGGTFSDIDAFSSQEIRPLQPASAALLTGGRGSGASFTYKMRGRDDGRAPGSDYIVWTSAGEPDFGGAGFAGGTPTPIGSLVAGSVVNTAVLGDALS
jgi:hypothetical protein